jgi:SAM-dependent methyltransferase
MTEIEALVEGTNVVLPDYTTRHFTEDQIERATHRAFVSGGTGDLWERGGLGQLNFLKAQGLKPEHRFVDIGCGALRAGRFLVDYLDAGNYYGVDANRDLIQIGYDREFSDEQRAKLPAANLRANDRFNADFGVQFDMAIAQSVFTHVSLNHMRLCLHRMAKVMRPGGVFYASFVEQPERTAIDHIFQRRKNGRTYFYEKNVFWYHRSDLRWVAKGEPWSFRFVGEYDSPQNQLMVAYTRLSDAEVQANAPAPAKPAPAKPAQANPASDRRKQVNAKIREGGAAAYLLRARRRAAKIISPY